MLKITSRNNEKIKAAVRLRDSAKARREEGMFFLEGARLCADAASNVDIVRLFFTAKAKEKYAEKDINKIMLEKSKKFTI